MSIQSKNTPIDYQIVSQKLKESNLDSPGKASIREIKKLIDEIENATGKKYVRMEMGVPGLPPTKVGVDAEIDALKKGVAAIYPDIYGIQPIKLEASRFVKLFMNINVDPESCIPTGGSMMGSFASFLTIHKCNPLKYITLLIDPGFPVHHQQLIALGQRFETFDVYDFRGEIFHAYFIQILIIPHGFVLLKGN